VEVLICEVGSAESLFDLSDLVVDGIEFVLEESNFVFLDVVGFGLKKTENLESSDLLVMGLDPNVNLLLLLHGICQFQLVSLHLAADGNLVISL